MNDRKENDWIVAGINNPDKSTSDFLMAGINIDNTQLLSADEYKRSDYIRSAFQKNGAFDEIAFDEYYRKRVSDYGDLSKNKIDRKLMYQPFDPRAKADGSDTISPEYNVEYMHNPMDARIDFMGNVYAPNTSMREKAQESKIYDVKSGEFIDETPNDRSLLGHFGSFNWLKSLTGDSLVYAKYETDGTHIDPWTGEEVKHKAGEYKLNEFGRPYTETLGDRNTIGKEFVSNLDLITIDGEGINKYDFMDSDGIDKSVIGVVAKTAATVVPIFIPYVGEVYATAMITKSLAEAAPMLHDMVTSMPLLNLDNSDNKFINRVAGFAHKFDSSVSDNGSSSVFNWEVLGNLVADVAVQFSEQKLIANGIAKLRGIDKLNQKAMEKAKDAYFLEYEILKDKLAAEKITQSAFEKYVGTPATWHKSLVGEKLIKSFTNGIEKEVSAARRLGADAALAYMAIISNTDVYESMIEHGATKKDASAVAIGSTIGMFMMDKYLGLGELFFDDLTAESEHQIRRILTKDAESWYKNTIATDSALASSSRDRFGRLVNSAMNRTKAKLQKAFGDYADDLKFHTTGFWGKTIGEGLEEVGEEVITDLSKQMYEWAGDLGFDTSTKDVGAFENMLPRYSMSFFGGALGGGIFYGANTLKSGTLKLDRTQDDIIYLARNGKTQEALDALESMRKRGRLGSKSLSVESTVGINGEKVYLTANKNRKSQNDYIYDRIKESIITIDSMINSDENAMSDNELFFKLIMDEERFVNLQSHLDLQGFSYVTGYQNEYQKRLNELVNAKEALSLAERSLDGNPVRQEVPPTDEQFRGLTEEQKETRKNNIERVKARVEQAKKDIDDFNSGKASYDYVEKLMFAMDDNMNSDFVSMNFAHWVAKNHNGRTIDSLSVEERNAYKKKYLEYKKSNQKEDLDTSFKMYKALQAALNPLIEGLKEKTPEIRQAVNDYYELDDLLQQVRILGYDDQIDAKIEVTNGETEETIIHPEESADSDNYKNRYNPEVMSWRIDAINDINRSRTTAIVEKINEIVEKNKGNMPADLMRRLTNALNLRIKDTEKKHQDLFKMKLEVLSSTRDENGNIVKPEELSEEDSFLLGLTKAQSSLNDALGAYRQNLIAKLYKTPIIDGITLYELYNKFIVLNKDSRYDEDNETGDVYLFNENEQLENNGSLSDEDFDRYYNAAKKIAKQVRVNKLIKDGIPVIINDNGDVELDVDPTNYTEEQLDSMLAAVEESNKNPGDILLSIYNPSLLGLFTDDYNQAIENARKKLDIYYKELESDPIYELADKLKDGFEDIESPLKGLIEGVTKMFGMSTDSLMDVFQKLHQRYLNEEDKGDITLNEEQSELFDEAETVIKTIAKFLYSASTGDGSLNSFGHNKFLNDLKQKHPDLFGDKEDLVEIDGDMANSLGRYLNIFLDEMGVVDDKTNSYTLGSWRWLSELNRIGKKQQHILAEKALNKTIYDFFGTNRNAFKFIYDGEEIDLLDGFEGLDKLSNDRTKNAVILAKLSNIFYENVNKLIKKGWTYKDVFSRAGFFDSESDNNIVLSEDAIKQDTSVLNEKLTYDTMTAFDKAMFLATMSGLSSFDFYEYLNKRVEEEKNIVPLTVQEWMSRMDVAMMSNPEAFNSVLELIVENVPEEMRVPIIRNAVYDEGNGGAGKSRVIAKNAALFKPGARVWLSTPAETQIKTLYDSIGFGEKMLNRKRLSDGGEEKAGLFERIIENYDKFAALQNDLSNRADFDESAVNKITLENRDINITLKDGVFKIKKMDNNNKPDVIVIDEATYLSSLELQVLSEFAKINDVKLIFLGNNKQNGYKGFGNGLSESNSLIIARTPNLGITLRDGNGQHQKNQKIFEKLMDSLHQIPEGDLEKRYVGNIISDTLIGSKLAYYKDENTFNGDYITNELTDEFIKLLNGTICFIGEPKGDTYQKLKDSGIDFTVLSPEDVQGQEFDYVIVDRTFPQMLTLSNNNAKNNLLKDLYTMITRSRKGTIFIDTYSSVSKNIGGSKQEFVKSEIESVTSYVDEFRDEKIKSIAEINAVNPNKVKKSDNREQPKEAPAKSNQSNTTQEDNNKITNPKPEKEGTDNPEQESPETESTPQPKNIKTISVDDLDDLSSAFWYIGIMNPNISKSDLLKLPNGIANVKLRVNDLENKNEDSVLYVVAIPRLSDSLADDLGEKNISDFIDYQIQVSGHSIEEDIVTKPDDDAGMNDDSYKSKAQKSDDDLAQQSMVDQEKENQKIKFDDRILCYGEGNFTSMPVTRGMSDEGKEIDVWMPNQENPDRDVNMFLSEDEKKNGVNNVIRQRELTYKLRALKEYFLYKKDEVPASIANMFTKEDLDKITLGIEVRMIDDSDQFIRNNGLDNNRVEIEIDGKKAVFAIIANVKTKDGRDVSFTMGLMADPNAWTNGGKRAENYMAFMKKLIDNVDESNPVYKLSNINEFITYSLTDIHQNEDGKIIRLHKLYPAVIRQLEVKLENLMDDPERNKNRIAKLQKRIEEYKNMKEVSFRSLHPYSVISPMYIYAPDDKSPVNEISGKVSGRMVVFVSNDSSLDPGDLAKMWVKQQASRHNGSPLNSAPVRMIPLTNLGVSFNDLSNPYLASVLSSEGGKMGGLFPFKTNYTGARMYVGMWNFRANLSRFLEVLNSFSDMSVDEINNKLNELGIKQFRLKTEDRNGNGAHIQNLSSDGNINKTMRDLYDDRIKNPHMIYITKETASKYYDIISSIFTNVIDKIIDNSIKDEKMLLSTNVNGKLKNSLAGNVRSLIDNGNIEISGESYDENGNLIPETVTLKLSPTLNLPDGIILENAFSHIPIVMAKIFKYTQMALSSRSIDDIKSKDKYIIKISSNLDNDFEDYYIPYKKIWENNSIFDDGGLNWTNMFNFMFHGTLEDVQNPSVIRASDALFPNGFYVDPMASVNASEKVGGLFYEAYQNSYFFGVNVHLGYPTFFISLEGASKKIEENKATVSKFTPNQSEIESAYNGVEVGLEMKRLIDKALMAESREDYDNAINEIKEYTESTINKNRKSFLDSKNKTNEDLSTVIYKDNNKIITVKDYLTSALMSFDKSLPDKIDISLDNNKIIVNSGSESIAEYNLKLGDGENDISFEAIGKDIEATPLNMDEMINKANSISNNELSNKIKDILNDKSNVNSKRERISEILNSAPSSSRVKIRQIVKMLSNTNCK